MLINNSLELIGSMDADLSNYLTADSQVITSLNTSVSNLSTNFSNLSSTVSGLSTTVSNLSTDITNLSTTVGSLQNSLDDYVLTTTFESVVGDLSLVNGVINELSINASIADTLDDIYDRLTWKELSE